MVKSFKFSIDNAVRKAIGNHNSTLPSAFRPMGGGLFSDNISKPKRIPQMIHVDGKPVFFKTKKNLPNIKVLRDVYGHVSDDRATPVVVEEKEQYLNEYISNQEKAKGIKFTEKEKEEYKKRELKDMRDVVARYTTKKNKYIEPRVVIFSDIKLPDNMLKDTLYHEYAHEVWEKNPKIRKDWKSVGKSSSPTEYGKTDREEDFADSYALSKSGQLEDKNREMVIDKYGKDKKFKARVRLYWEGIVDAKNKDDAKQEAKDNAVNWAEPEEVEIDKYIEDDDSPSAILYHGTSQKNLPRIKKHGYGKTDREEDFADSYALSKSGQLEDKNREMVIDKYGKDKKFKARVRLYWEGIVDAKNKDDAKQEAKDNAVNWAEPEEVEIDKYIEDDDSPSAILYHGTSQKNLPRIKKHGLVPYPNYWGKPAVFLAPSKSMAKYYAKDDGVILKVFVPDDEVKEHDVEAHRDDDFYQIKLFRGIEPQHISIDDARNAHPVIKAVHSLTGRSAIFDPTQGATDSISQASRLNPEFTDFEWIWVPDNPTSNTLGGNSVFNMGSLGGSSSLNMGGIEEPQIGSGILTAGAMGLLNPGETLGVEDFVPDKVATEEKQTKIPQYNISPADVQMGEVTVTQGDENNA
jgi:hypothetical protein